MSGKESRWKFAVDRGGTFTDVVAVDPQGYFHTYKLLSKSPEYSNASIEGIRRILDLKPDQSIETKNIKAIRFGTTVATNALLERRGGKVALFITKDLTDLLEISYQTRPEIFNLRIEKPSLLYTDIIEVDERINCNGDIIKEVNTELLEEKLESIKRKRYDAVSVVLMHSWKNPEHELIVESILEKYNYSNIFLSHKTINLIKIVSRGQSTVMDAYLSPVIAQYMEGINKSVGDIPVEFIQSSGGLSSPKDFKGKDAILSGPAGGVIAVAKVTDSYGLSGAIGFDMGGTSTDVSRYDGEFEKIYEQVIAGVELQKESLNIVTIASGGGSMLWFDGQKMKVGPQSAGAHPGPACYGFGGPLTVTDANFITGRIASEFFPKTFGPERNSSLDMEVVKERFFFLAKTISNATKKNLSVLETALGFIRIANEQMAMAIKEISVSKGFDVRNYALLCFGGAGGQHACQIASLLGIKKILFHPLSGVMSAYGIGLASPVRQMALTVLKPFDRESYEDLENLFATTIEDMVDCELATCKIIREVDLRPAGTDSYLTVPYMEYSLTLEEFKDKYQKLYGFQLDETPLEIVNIRLSIQETGNYFSQFKEKLPDSNNKPEPVSYQEIYYIERTMNAPVYIRENLPAFTQITGPAFIIDSYSTLIVDPGYIATVKDNGIIELFATEQKQNIVEDDKARPDPVLLEVFSNLFMGIASEMGHTLRNTSHSVNIKERLDFSCAIFDSKGDLVANAPHIPVHLGSMTDTVKSVIEDHRDNIEPGDIYISNNPYRGGSHLPDVTVVSPVFSSDNKILFFTAARGHHADIGGSTPGSLPPKANHINDEGVLLTNFLAVREGKLREKELKENLLSHKYPVRNLNERIYDLKAQIASCNKGAYELKQLIDKYGFTIVNNYMYFIQENAEFCVKLALSEYLKGRNQFKTSFEDYLDDGTLIRVQITITAGDNPPETVKAKIDFTGTGQQHSEDNLNTPLSVTRSAILYVLRSLTEVDIPLNSGCLNPIEIVVPEGCLLNPVYPAPVASGNVETSQRIVDVLLGALKVSSASQGTMNNFLFEVEEDTPYYETIAGGAGALEGYNGASAVQVHMTNTRMTDPEVLEYRHPGVRLEQFKVRRGSGGKGKYTGGDGVIRELKFLKPSVISIISERRNYKPYGMNGGQAGLSGKNTLCKANREQINLPHRVELKLEANDSIIIETPGAGGYGKPQK